ncbi:carbohydrate ABC transporter membrane protein 1 (CUT1 family) [Streptomyces sp. PanSC19]|uniref:carbohydrate ABC transporter permease n=1 Tax=Streptomyces sp. PanSC19 TaxID=1520455 RepID=UPI000F47F1B2|nr:sugar ABC transporter permease [Streptomyces sp. PanSC19]ROQ36120.1 carbohydrate ABC transporter membrane protein 1 (CUT1 family) [Streptomyces sp. PanSC19]
MSFDAVAQQPKLLYLLQGVAAFAAVVALVLLALHRGPVRRRAAALILLAPALLLLTVGLLLPALRTLALSFTDGGGDAWAGLDNYVWLFTDPRALVALRNTLAWVVLVPLTATAVGLLYAAAVVRSRFRTFALSLLLMPMAVSSVGAGVVWKFVYAYRPAGAEQIGLLNRLVVAFGGEPRQWLVDSPWNVLFLVVATVWTQAGFAAVLLAGAIRAVPGELTEAARLDGASPGQILRRIILPSIRPTLLVVLLAQAIGTLKAFDIVRTMTGGQFGTGVVAHEMYDQAFRYGETGRGAALAVLLLALVTPFVAHQVRARRRAG